jgi:hypothetical protein
VKSIPFDARVSDKNPAGAEERFVHIVEGVTAKIEIVLRLLAHDQTVLDVVIRVIFLKNISRLEIPHVIDNS